MRNIFALIAIIMLAFCAGAQDIWQNTRGQVTVGGDTATKISMPVQSGGVTYMRLRAFVPFSAGDSIQLEIGMSLISPVEIVAGTEIQHTTQYAPMDTVTYLTEIDTIIETIDGEDTTYDTSYTVTDVDGDTVSYAGYVMSETNVYTKLGAFPNMYAEKFLAPYARPLAGHRAAFPVNVVFNTSRLIQYFRK